MIALTHAHPDHWGAAPELSAGLRVPVAVHDADAGIVAGTATAGAQIAFRLGRRLLENGVCRDIIRLREGDQLGGFTVIHAPGHSAGHVVYFRESDGLAIIGDLFNTMEMWTRRRRLGEPPPNLSINAAENRRSIVKLIELRPSLILPGHGPALHDMTALATFAARWSVTENAGATAA